MISRVVNTDVLRNPLNWISMGAMIALVLFAGFVIYTRIKADKPSLNDGSAQLASET